MFMDRFIIGLNTVAIPLGINFNNLYEIQKYPKLCGRWGKVRIVSLLRIIGSKYVVQIKQIMEHSQPSFNSYDKTSYKI